MIQIRRIAATDTHAAAKALLELRALKSSPPPTHAREATDTQDEEHEAGDGTYVRKCSTHVNARALAYMFRAIVSDAEQRRSALALHDNSHSCLSIIGSGVYRREEELSRSAVSLGTAK